MNMLRFASILPLCLLCIGCATLQKPTATIKGMTVANVNANGFTMNFDVDLHNPNSIAMPLTNADYKLGLGGVSVLDGKAKPSGSIPANGATSFTLPVNLTYDNLFSAVDAIRKTGGDVPYTLDGGLDLSAGAMSLGQSYRVPLQFSGTLPLRQVLRNPSVLLNSPTARKLAEDALGGLLGH